MTRAVYRVDIDRVVVVGMESGHLRASELRALVEAAVVRELTTAPLPAGRVMRASVQVNAPSTAAGGGSPLASAVARGVAVALGGGASRG
jgi:hypothetical protein